MSYKFIFSLIISFIIALIAPINVSAQDNSGNTVEDEYFNIVEENLSDKINKDAEEFINENGISVSDPNSVTELSFGSLVSFFINKLTAVIKTPLKTFAACVSVMLICMIAKLVLLDNSISKFIETCGILLCVLAASFSLTETVGAVKSAIEDGALFMTSFVPVFTAAVAAGGSPTSAAGYYTAVLTVCEAGTFIVGAIVVPIINSVTALSIVETLNEDFPIITNALNKAAVWTIGVVMTVFVGLLSIRSLIGNAADTVAARTVKFAAASFIPIVGGAVSEAYSTVKGSLSLIKSSVRVFGLVIVFIMFMIPLITVLGVKIALDLSSFFGELIGCFKICSLFKKFSSALAIEIAVLLSFLLMFLISTSVVLLAGGGG